MSFCGARAWIRRALPLTFAALLLSCGPASPSLPLEVDYGGCSAVYLPGPICVLPSTREIRLWVSAPRDSRVEIQIEGRSIETPAVTVRGGQQFSMTLPPRVRSATVDMEALEGRVSWKLRFAGPKDPVLKRPGIREVLNETRQKARRVHEYVERSQLPMARETLHTFRLPPEAPAESRYLASYYRGLLAEREGDYRTAVTEVERSIEIAERTGLEKHQALGELKLALLWRSVGRSRDAAQLFDRLRRSLTFQDSCDEAQLLVNQAWSELLAREAGEHMADPSPLLERALASYATCKTTTPEKTSNILINLALADVQEGRLAGAKDHLSWAHEVEPHPPLAQILWRLDLEARIALREGRPNEALRQYEELEELAVRISPDDRLRAAFGKAQSHKALGNPSAALEILRRAETILDEQSLQIPIHEGRETFVATRQAIVSLHIDLLLGQRRTEEALEVTRHARSRLLRQLEHVDRLASLSPDRKARWAELLMDYQAKRAALEEQARDDWKLSASELRRVRAARESESKTAKGLLDQAFLILGSPRELEAAAVPPPRAGELILAYHPLADGWVGFAADQTAVVVRRFDLPADPLCRPTEELAQRLLHPFRASIARAGRIRILSSGHLRCVDFHALPFAGDILLAKAPVVYGLDLAVSTSAEPTQGRSALVVADPRSDLPGALAEGRAVHETLGSGAQPWVTEELKQAKATAEAVRGRLPFADLFHYAGHGTFSGRGGWDSSLLLAEESQLTLGDLLSLERAPTWVVLSACDTGKSSPETPVESLGLAHAFLLAGSRAVVASTRPAEDRLVQAFITELYRRWGRDPDLATAVQRSQLAWRKHSPDADWASFRLFEP